MIRFTALFVIFLVFIQFTYISNQFTPEGGYDIFQKIQENEIKLQELKEKIIALKNEMKTKTSDSSSNLELLKENLRNNGIKLGNRWWIGEEGTGNYNALVFRDKKATGDKRVAFWPSKSVNL